MKASHYVFEGSHFDNTKHVRVTYEMACKVEISPREVLQNTQEGQVFHWQLGLVYSTVYKDFKNTI